MVDALKPESRAAREEMARLCKDEKWRLAVWDLETGLRTPGRDGGGTGEASDPLAVVRALGALALPEGTALLVLVNFHRFLQSTEIVQALARQITAGKQNRTFIVVLAPVVQIPTELEKLFLVVDHDLPGRDQLLEIAQGVLLEAGLEHSALQPTLVYA